MALQKLAAIGLLASMLVGAPRVTTKPTLAPNKLTAPSSDTGKTKPMKRRTKKRMPRIWRSLDHIDRMRKGDLLSRGGQYRRVVKCLNLTVTAYDANCKECGTGKRTCTHSSALRPGLAVDPRVIPLKSTVALGLKSGPEELKADDKGGKIKKFRADLRKKTHKEAADFGIQRGVPAVVLQ